jgi:hypothetical protein
LTFSVENIENFLHRSPYLQLEPVHPRPVDYYYSSNHEFKFEFDPPATPNPNGGKGTGFQLRHMPSAPYVRSRQLDNIMNTFGPTSCKAADSDVDKSSCCDDIQKRKCCDEIMSIMDIENRLRAEQQKQTGAQEQSESNIRQRVRVGILLQRRGATSFSRHQQEPTANFESSPPM